MFVKFLCGILVLWNAIQLRVEVEEAVYAYEKISESGGCLVNKNSMIRLFR